MRLTVPRTKLELLHPADIADIVHELTPEERAAVFDALEDEVAADTFEEMHPSYQASLLLDLPDDKASELLGEHVAGRRRRPARRPARRAPPSTSSRMMEKDDAEDMRELLSYPEHSAGGIMTTEFAYVRAGRDRRRGDRAPARAGAARSRPSTTSTWSTAREHLLGVFSLRDLLTAPPDAQGARLHDREPGLRAPRRPARKRSPRSIAKYNLLALPVVDDEGVLHGIITVDDAIDLVLPLAWKKRLPRIFH